MIKLPAWARGPYELIEHAEGHYHGNTDVDRRMALIGFDNAIEVTITTYLLLNPKLRGGATFKKDDTQKWLQNYHTKIEFFEQFTDTNSIVLESSTAEIIWYHTLRNELYHSGNGMVPERHCLNGSRDAAIEVFKILFRVDVTPFLTASRTVNVQAEQPSKQVATVSNQFLQSFISFERTLRASALALGVEVDSRSEGVVRLWNAFKKHTDLGIAQFDPIVQKAREARNQFVHTGITDCTEQELIYLAGQLDEISSFLLSHGYSLDILPTLQERYGDWVKPEITTVRIIHKDGSAFLEVTSQARGFFDEEIKRVDLNFIANEDDAPLFLPTRRAQENADRFFDELNLYSILMTGIGELLFTPIGIDAAIKLSGANVGKSTGEITRRL